MKQSPREAAIAWHYDQVSASYVHTDLRMEQVMRRLSGIAEGASILDVGCATGNLLLRLHRVRPGGRAVGVDISTGALERASRHAREMNLENVEFRRGSATALPCDDAEFHVAVSNMVLHLIPDRRTALAELVRVLRPGGRAVLRFMGGAEVLPEWIGLLRSAWMAHLPDREPPVLFHAITTQEIESLLGELGIREFEIVRRHSVNPVRETDVEDRLRMLRLVSDFWRHDLDPGIADRIGTHMEHALRESVARHGSFPITANNLLVDFLR